MQSIIQTTASPQQVWAFFCKAHGELVPGQKGKSRFRYQVLSVCKGESFTLLWKGLFVRFIATYAVYPMDRTAHHEVSKICYSIEIRGLFGWLTRALLKKKMKRNLDQALQELKKIIESAP